MNMDNRLGTSNWALFLTTKNQVFYNILKMPPKTVKGGRYRPKWSIETFLRAAAKNVVCSPNWQ